MTHRHESCAALRLPEDLHRALELLVTHKLWLLMAPIFESRGSLGPHSTILNPPLGVIYQLSVPIYQQYTPIPEGIDSQGYYLYQLMYFVHEYH